MYLPKSKYRVRAALPGEFTTGNGQDYVGPVVETFTGACYPGTDPKTVGPKLERSGTREPIELGLYNIKRIPTEAEYTAGSMIRYFMQDRKTQKIIEIGPEAWQKNYNPHDIYRTWATVTWRLTGTKNLVQELNGEVIETTEKVMPGIISSRVLYDPLQFYRTKI